MSEGNDREFIDHLQKKEGGKAMKCPLFVAARATQHLTRSSPASDCLKEECAWWSKAIGACSILGLEVSLSLIGALLLEIKDKMPHSGQFLQKP